MTARKGLNKIDEPRTDPDKVQRPSQRAITV